ncbi:tectonic-1-like isoform X2 [Palaemon carinicauda]|uniref:tectonic-1-like isoform X2 n=1 Tax=Palaemon carinicauda TaxID=392227 RepID=UPI0035B5E245
MALLYIIYVFMMVLCRIVPFSAQYSEEDEPATLLNIEESTQVPTEITFQGIVNDTLDNITETREFDEYEEETNASTTTISPTMSTDATEEPPTSLTPDGITERGITLEDFCLCDLTVNVCDINCCCDEDCDTEDKKVFSHCQERPQPVLDSRYCFQEHIVFSNHTEYSVSFAHPGILCIATDNLKLRTTYTSVKGAATFEEFQKLGREKRLSYAWVLPQKTSPVSLKPYRDGTNIWALDRNGTSFPAGIPSSVVGSECETTTPLMFLRNAVSLCIRTFQTLAVDCVANSYLDPHSYLDFSFIADPSRLFQNKSRENEITSTESDSSFSLSTAESVSNKSTDVTVTPSLYESTLLPTNTTEAEGEVDGEHQSSIISSLGEIAEALSNFGDLYPNDVVSITPDICHTMADGEEECSERALSAVSHPFYDNGTCRNALVRVKYVIRHNGSKGILNVKAKIYLTNLTDAQRQVRQGFEVKFEWQSSDKQESVLERSGRPGYLRGKPLLMGKLVENRTEEDILKSAIQLSADPNQWLKILAPGNRGQCDSSTQVTFGIDIGSGCLLEVSPGEFEQVCGVLQKKILSKLFGSAPLNDAALRVASFGDSSINSPADWVPLLMTEEPQCGTLGQSYGSGQYFSLVTSLHIEIAFTLQGSLANPQAKVVGINVRFGDPQEVYPPCWHNMCHYASASVTGNVELKVSVSFVDVSHPPLPAYSQPPALDVKLPYDFFYPFLPSRSSSSKFQDAKMCLFSGFLCLLIIKNL